VLLVARWGLVVDRWAGGGYEQVLLAVSESDPAASPRRLLGRLVVTRPLALFGGISAVRLVTVE